MKYRKFLNFILILILGLTISSCYKNYEGEENTPLSETVDFQLLAVNDTHGYIEDTTTAGISKTAAFIKSEVAKKDKETIVISVGDMFQGTAISNLTQGRVVNDCMNEIGFDTMTIGNHEFDWGIKEIARFKDGNKENGEANYNILAANIVYKGTDTLMEFTKPYQIIERQGVKVGIIGVIGESLTNSISASMVKDYEFKNALEVTKKYTKELRTEKDCDIVVLSYHYGSSNNSQFTALTGDYRLDAILNGHTHLAESKKDPIPQIQSESNGKYVGEVNLTYNKTKEKIVLSSAKLNKVSEMTAKDTNVAKIVNDTLSTIAPLINAKLGTLSGGFSKTEMAVYGCKVIKSAFDVDFAMVNYGGIRSNLADGKVTYGDMVQMVPFDNEIKLVTLTGAQVILAYGGIDVAAYPKKNGNNYVDAKGNLIDNNKLYRVAAIDYIFDKTNFIFLSGQNIEITGIKFRDILVKDLEIAKDNYNIYNSCFITKIEW